MKTNNLIKMVGQRVDVDFIRTQEWQSEKYIRNGIVMRITKASQLVVYVDELSEHSHSFTGGCLYSSSYNIKTCKS